MAGLGLTPADLQGTVLVRDCLEAQGAFLLAHLIKLAVSCDAHTPGAAPGGAALPPLAAAAQSRPVVLLAAQQAASHYTAVLRKVGLSVPSLLASGQLAVVDLLPSLGGGLPSLRTLHERLAAAVAGLCGGSNGCDSRPQEAGGVAGSVVLLIDDLAVRAAGQKLGGEALPKPHSHAVF
jgi:hypothetical protein